MTGSNAQLAVDLVWDDAADRTWQAGQHGLGQDDGLGELLVRGVLAAAADRGYERGSVTVRVSDNATIEQCNRQFMNHDYPTDVISFAYRSELPFLEGEMIVSAEMAGQRAAEFGWRPRHELLLYVVHGTLHLTGMDDRDRPSRQRMREAERRVLARLGIGDDDCRRIGDEFTRGRAAEESA